MKAILTAAFLLISFAAAAADLTIPRIDVATMGRTVDGELALVSSVSADLALSGGYKYGILLGFSFNSNNLGKAVAGRNFQIGHLGGDDPVSVEDYNNLVDHMNSQAALTFRVIRATARNLFNLPVDLNFFIGEGDDFCTDDEFIYRFGYAPFDTDYRGLFFFPNGIGGDISRQYNGLHRARGTGISLAFTSGSLILPMLYLYHENYNPFMNGSNSKPLYSADARFLFNFDNVRMETFAGMSWSANPIFRGGLAAHFIAGSSAEFLFQGGVPGWNPEEKINIDNLYFLMEPRLKFGNFGMNVTFFYYPVTYHNIATPEEQGKADINFKAYIEIPKTSFTTGLDTTMNLNINAMDEMAVSLSPFVSFSNSGLRWDARVRFNMLEFRNLDNFFEMFIGVSSSF